MLAGGWSSVGSSSNPKSRAETIGACYNITYAAELKQKTATQEEMGATWLLQQLMVNSFKEVVMKITFHQTPSFCICFCIILLSLELISKQGVIGVNIELYYLLLIVC